LLVLAIILVAAFDEMDMVTTCTSVITCLNNVGPGMGGILGATGNYATLSMGSKAVLSFCMLAGRLEVFPMLLVFIPSTWKRA
ncbi:MAG: TrkH family potassium uptake protein, partial [Clostridia bacterium]|nr:TrkH family potassium uptake protein [Clostridia bacterium]